MSIAQTFERIYRAMELEPDPMKRASMMAIMRQTLRRLDEMHRTYFGDEGERSE